MPSSILKQSARLKAAARRNWLKVTHTIVGERLRMTWAVCRAQPAYSMRVSDSSDARIPKTVGFEKCASIAARNAGSLGGGLTGLGQTGGSLVTVWRNAAAEVAAALSTALGTSLGVGFPGLSEASTTIATGLANAVIGLDQTGGALVLGLNDAAIDIATNLVNLQLAIQAAFRASFRTG